MYMHVRASIRLRSSENETYISARSAPARVRGHPPLVPHGELLYLISREGRTLIKRSAINNVESQARSRVALTPPRAFPSACEEFCRGLRPDTLVEQFS